MDGALSNDLTVDLWDVGQGNASVITLPDGSLVIVDVGPRNGPLADWLLRTQPHVRAIAVTHNDGDHIGALPAITGDSRLKIDTVFLMRDPKSDRDSKRFILQFNALYERQRRGDTRVRHLVGGTKLWAADNGTAGVEAVFPDYFANLEANTPNATSGIVVLRWDEQPVVVWAGDAPLADVAGSAAGGTPAVLDGPHHGAPQRTGVKEMKPHLRQIDARRLHVSVGSSNTYDHPQPRYLKEALRAGMTVTCTQITHKCGWRLGDHPFMQISGKLGLPSPSTGCPCRGTTRIRIGAGGIRFDQWDAQHRETVKTAVRQAVCRRAG